jgi:hypothetical protein
MTKPRRSATASEGCNAEEQSGVRLRAADAEGKVRSERSEPPPSEVARCLRVEQKVRVAQLVLDALPGGAARARLLRTAIVRRDEVLIDAVLGQLRMLP